MIRSEPVRRSRTPKPPHPGACTSAGTRTRTSARKISGRSYRRHHNHGWSRTSRRHKQTASIPTGGDPELSPTGSAAREKFVECSERRPERDEREAGPEHASFAHYYGGCRSVPPG